MEEQQLPFGLSGQDLYVAENLLLQGFCYCGYSDDFCIGHFMEELEGWELYFSHGELGIEVVLGTQAVCNKALFCLDLEFSELNPEEELDRVKELISTALYQWNHDSQNHHQLEILAA